MESSPLLPIRENSINLDSGRKFYNSLALGILCISIASFVIQTELAQSIQTGKKFHKPYFLVWIVHSCWVIMIPLQFVFQPNFQAYIAEFFRTGNELVSKVNPTYQINYVEDEEDEEDGVAQHRFISVPHKYILAYLLKTSFFLAVIVCAVGYSWYVAVNYTTMANLTAIYNTSCFWAYAFSVLLLGESVQIEKVCSVFLSIAGVIIMALYQTDPTLGYDVGGDAVGGNGIFHTGDLIALFGAASYGLYEVLYKKYGSPPTPSILFSNTVTGLIGVFSLLFLWVPIPILHYTGMEEFSFPDMKTFGYILLMAFSGVVFNASFMVVIALTSPIFAAIGILLTIPAVAFVDALVINSSLDTGTFVGSLCILMSFVLLSWKSIRDEIEKRRSN